MIAVKKRTNARVHRELNKVSGGIVRKLADGRVIDLTPQPDPTLDEIAERCAEIQSSWTDEERAKRVVFNTYLWTAPELSGKAYGDRELAE